ncbi:MAG TPA: ribosomal protein S18-alanine N-acetyltransferase [Candidatus Angelobacter sp.]
MIRIRSGAPADLERLLEIAGHSATAARWSRQEYAKLFSPAPELSRTLLVVEEDGLVAGFIVAHAVEREWEIENIAVSGPARRRGLGSHLLGEFLDVVRDQGGQAVFLEVRESNQAARKLYEKWAFSETGRRKDYYQDPPEDALVFTFSLPRAGDFD